MKPRSSSYVAFLAALIASLVLAAASATHARATFARSESLDFNSAVEEAAIAPTGRPAEIAVAGGAGASARRPSAWWPFAGNLVFLKGGSVNAFGYFLIGLGLTLAVSGSIVLAYSSRRRSRLVAAANKRTISLD